jgi:hypothetical protein
MGVNVRTVQQFTVGSEVFSFNKTLSADSLLQKRLSVAGAKTGTLTTRTDDDTGSLTMAASHGIITGDTIDVYWSGGSRRGMTVGTVATNVVPIDGGTGDVLPAATTSITAQVVTEEPLVFAGDDATGIVVYAEAKSIVRLFTAGGEQFARHLEAGQVYIWSFGSGETNPVAGDAITELHVSQGSTTADQEIFVGVLLP